jgi:Zn-dependent M28 family amino/carboxypeptidase
MSRSRGFDEYGRVGEQRFRGAIEAARVGARGAIVRSIGTGKHRLAHTGATQYDPKVPMIPFAAIAVEDADYLHRKLERGTVTVKMRLGARTGPPAPSANVVGELRGRERPEEIVLVGAHLDSWDVGDGALDDAAGVGMALEVARLLRDARPRRTIRVVLFANEECGLSGAKAYAAAHAAELRRHVAAMEADAGGGAPIGLGFNVDEAARDRVRRLVGPLEALRVTDVRHTEHAGADLMPLTGVPQLALEQDATDYFEWHHTDGDTADKIDPIQISKAAGALAVLIAELADGEPLPRAPSPSR